MCRWIQTVRFNNDKEQTEAKRLQHSMIKFNLFVDGVGFSCETFLLQWCERRFCIVHYDFLRHSLNTIQSIGGSWGDARDARPPGGPNSFIFRQFLAKNLKIALLGVGAPLGKILDPPLQR